MTRGPLHLGANSRSRLAKPFPRGLLDRAALAFGGDGGYPVFGMDADELIRRFGAKVYNLALRLTGNPADAAALAQDSLIKAVRGLPSFRGGDPGVWMYRITVNAWKNFLRSKSTRRMLRFFAPDGNGIEAE